MVESAAYWEITHSIHRLWRALERFDYEAVTALLSENCRWNRGGRWREGHAEIRAVLSERPLDRIVRHYICSLTVDREADLFVARYTIASFHNGGAPEKQPPYSTLGTRIIADCTDHLAWHGDKLVFTRLDAAALFLAKD